MKRHEIEMVRSMIEDGMTDQQIAHVMNEAEIESAEAADFEERAYGIDDRSEDHRSYSQQVMCDRLDMGRNDAGEWLGFM